MEDEKKKILS